MANRGVLRRIEQGDCIESISFEAGHLPETVWNHPGNTELRKLRKNPNLLLPGDLVEIPELKTRNEQCAAEARHRFRRKAVPVHIRLRILGPPTPTEEETEDSDLHGPDDVDEEETTEEEPDAREPRANTPFVAHVDGLSLEGKTDDDGCLEIFVPPAARQLTLQVGETPLVDELVIDLGATDPITEISGVQHRLANLDYRPGPIDGVVGPLTRAAIRRFQTAEGLEPTGEIDSVTRDRLLDAHGC